MTEFFAHSTNEDGHRHGLVEHLRAVAELAREFGEHFGAGDTAYYAGLWHDLGKFNPEFQRYLLGDRPRGPDHKASGTRLACQHLGLGGLMIQGHHGGLRAKKDLAGWLNEKNSDAAVDQALRTARQEIPDLEPMETIEFPSFMARDPVKAELWLRMVFSALVDADYLDTERHFTSSKTAVRSPKLDIDRLWGLFQGRHSEHVKGAFGLVNEVRSKVYDACLAAAEKPPGIFRLAVPTGGGKTLSAMGFALRHATLHNLARVIVAVPFISITQQTAEVYREFLEENPLAEPKTVLEHHSMAQGHEGDEYDSNLVWSRLAAGDARLRAFPHSGGAEPGPRETPRGTAGPVGGLRRRSPRPPTGTYRSSRPVPSEVLR